MGKPKYWKGVAEIPEEEKQRDDPNKQEFGAGFPLGFPAICNVRDALSVNLCRCTTYQQNAPAVLEAAKNL